MIRINLLESITDKPTSAAVIVEKKVSNPASRLYLLIAVVTGLFFLTVGFDYLMATQAKATADAELAEQQETAKKLEGVMKEQAELDKKIKDIDDRINAIKDLRSKQGGPSAVLEALRERIVNAPGLYLETVEQKNDQLTITGNSPNEDTVSGFGRSLEFSSGLFSNLSISTERKTIAATQVQGPGGAPAQLGSNPDKPEPETVNFTIKCGYNAKAANALLLPDGTKSTNTSRTAVTPGTTASNNSTNQSSQIAKN